MALRFVLGGSGSGKSNYLYEMILKRTQESTEQLFFLIVPEQFSLQAQRELVQRQKNHGIMNIDVVSFARLAYRVFDELGLTHLQTLEETGKSLALRRVAQEREGQLQILRGSIRKSGYINEVKSILSELAQYRISPDQLSELAQDEGIPMPFRCRLMDLSILYQGLQEFLQDSYITAEQALEVLGREAGHSALLRGSILVLDGFTGFTPVQYEALASLMHYVKEIYVTVTLDEGEDPYLDRGMQDLFYLSKKTIRTLSGIAKEQGMQVAAPVCVPHGERSRYGRSEQLRWLEGNLFRSHGKPYGGPVSDLALTQLPGPREELTFVAAEIRRLIREEGFRYRDMAIVCGDVQMYGNYAPEIFEAYEIPYFLDQKRNVSRHALTEMIRAMLELLESDFAPERVMAYLRCGFSGIPTEELDLLENYLLANRIRGWKAWNEKWIRLAGISGVEELAAVNRIREQALAPFYAHGRAGKASYGDASMPFGRKEETGASQQGLPQRGDGVRPGVACRGEKLPLLENVREILRDKDASVREKTVALYRFLMAVDAQRKVEARRARLEQQGRQALAREYGQIYRLTMDLLDKLVALLPQEHMGLKEYRQLLEAGFAASGVGVIPPGYDSVVIGDTIRTRLPEIKILFFVGVNDGLAPRVERQGGLLSEQERQFFRQRGLELSPGMREQSFIQKFYLYLTLTKPSHRLYLSWCSANGEGKEIRRSYLAGTVQKLFPKLAPVSMKGPEERLQMATAESGKRLLTEGISVAREGNCSSDFAALLQWYLTKEEYRPMATRLLSAAFYRYEPKWLSREAARELYGTALRSSVTRLEQFAACAYAHFIRYGIGVREREMGEFAPVDMGSIFHEALERYAGKLQQQGQSWTETSGEQQQRLAQEAMEETVEKVGWLLYQDARTAYGIRRMTRILRKTVETLTCQIADSDFTPEGCEVPFDVVENLPAVNFDLSGEERLRLLGRIDRIDVRDREDGIHVKVIDYKSGKQQFQLMSLYHGLQLQLAVYLSAAAEILRATYPGAEVIPSGMYYYHMDDPVIEVKGRVDEEEVSRKIYEQLKLQGVGSAEDDPSVSKSSQIMSREELSLLMRFAGHKIRSLGSQIYGGDVTLSPYLLKDQCACDYCPCKGICGFDVGFRGCGYRRLAQEADKEEILERMRREAAEGLEQGPGSEDMPGQMRKEAADGDDIH